MTEEFSAVRLELESRPEAPALVRAALAGAAELLELDPELFDDLTTAISEACNNVVIHAYDGRPGPLLVGLEVGPGGIDATIRDRGGGIQHVGGSEERMGVGLAVISALADRAEFITAPEGGTEVRMAFAGPRAAAQPIERPGDVDREADPGAGPRVQLSGDVVATVRPVGLLAGVLGRVTRAVAARTHLSLDRFSDIYLVTDAISALAESSASAVEVTFAVTAARRRLELTVGPFEAGKGARLMEEGLVNGVGSPLASALGDFAVEPRDGFALVRAVVEERRGAR